MLDKTRKERNRQIGRKVGLLAYFFLYNKLPFLLFEKFLPYFAMIEVDIGQINHTEHFLRNLVNPCYEELQKRLRSHLTKILPCTDSPSPITLLADKGTIKHDTSQVTLIKTLCLKNKVMFERFFVGNPLVTDNSGVGVTTLLIKTVCNTLNWTIEELRERYSGACYDGQYIHLAVRSHQADILNLPSSLMKDSVTHDAAHRLELACKDTEDGRKRMDGTELFKGTKWLQDLINVLQHIMKIYRFGKHHSDLNKVAQEMGMSFLEFNLFSETRFVEHSHRTYDHFVRMYPVLFEKLKRDEEKNQDESIRIQNLLVQLQTVLDLLFMKELSHLLTYTSKEFQRFDTLPHYIMHVYEKFKSNLRSA